MAAEDKALRINAIKVKTDKQEGHVRYRMCKDREETATHLTSECSKLAQLEYKKRRDKVTGIVHCSLCEKYGLPRSEQWYRHIRLNQDRDRESQTPVSIQMDHVIEHRRPDIIVVEKNNNTALLTDIAVLRDTIVEENKKASIR